MKKQDKKLIILKAATRLAKKTSYEELVRDEIANEANVSFGLVTYYFGSMDNLKNCVVQYAIMKLDLKLIGQAIVNKHPLVKNLNSELKRSALQKYI